VQTIEHSLNLPKSALGAGGLLVFVRDGLCPLSVGFLSARSALVSVNVAKASRPVPRLRMFPDAGHNSGNRKVITSEVVRRNPRLSDPLVKGLRMDSYGRYRMTFNESGGSIPSPCTRLRPSSFGRPVRCGLICSGRLMRTKRSKAPEASAFVNWTGVAESSSKVSDFARRWFGHSASLGRTGRWPSRTFYYRRGLCDKPTYQPS
jgi:hypothetical protein